MKRFRVVVTERIPAGCLAPLASAKDIELIAGKNAYSLSRAALKRRVKGAHALLTVLTDRVDEGLLAAAGPQLKIVANYAVGFDNIDLVAARRRGIIVTNTPGGASRAVAEHAWALILACAKRILEADAYVRRGKYKEWTATTLLGRGIHGKTLGIVGLGRIGEAVVEIGHRGFGTKILYTDPHPNRAFERRYDAARVPLNVLLKEADIVSLHVPLLPTTRHLIGARELARMKTTAILINTARGPVIDERALVAALKRRKIAAAGLDVFEHEPKLAPGLVKLSNAVLSPHTASSTWDARCFMGDLAARNILAALRGKPVLSRVA